MGETDLPGGTSVSIPNTARITVAAISMSTVPDTTGVIMRRNSDSRAATKNFSTDERTTSVAIITGPPLYQSRYADGDCGLGSSYYQNMTGAEAPELK